MDRVEIDVPAAWEAAKWSPSGFQALLTERVRDAGLPLMVDKDLLFWKHHFARGRVPGAVDWAMYDNGAKKGGTLRYRQGCVRVPSGPQLGVYETEEFKGGKPPKGIVTIDAISVGHVWQLTPDELWHDGFADHAHVVESMRKYYPDITRDSIVSFYLFGKTFWRLR